MTTGDDVMRERNARVQARYDALMLERKHGHYETMFRVVREEVERASKVTVDDAAVERAVKEYHGDCYISAADAQVHPRYARQRVRQQRDMRAALEAAFPAAPTSEWNAAIEAAAKAAENSYEGDEACGDWPTPEMVAEKIRALSKKD